LIAELREERRRACAIWQDSQRTERVFGAAGQAGHHVIGIDTNPFQLGDELSSDFRVRHRAPDWVWRRRPYVQRLLGGE
jgi:hypothetical protein